MKMHHGGLFRKVSVVATIKAHGKSTICVKSLLRCGTTPKISSVYPKSLYISRAATNFHGTEIEIWAGFVPDGSTGLIKNNF